MTTTPGMTPTETDTSTSPPSSPSTETTSSEIETTALLSMAVPGSRESKREKAVRYLMTGRLRVLRVDHDLVVAECRGDSGEVYNLLWKHQRWSCSCPARTDCSHMNALWAVVAVNRR